ncbi:hypothetical protein H6G74_25330 [Nostoc spongiaeforme FACHB-130]|uniref:Uncharacterized protein n=1 Tax=Nostoc spongiaeforme FACHB-130 TaxID=1357510 RepID=A0ABR8G350_9NOSO|nr:hypothetical protein [Nostoc spongiaeforme]MBD2597621.1 hypothetical protein [Nostoc spongiaeforme FACHB-130]
MKISTVTTYFITVASVILSAGIASAQTGSEKISRNPDVVNTTHGQVITTSVNSYMSPSNVANSHVMQPFNLVYLAYQGNLESQGIPSGNTLIFQHQHGNVKAEDVVKAAVNAKKIPNQFLYNPSYLSEVDVQLASLQKTFAH